MNKTTFDVNNFKYLENQIDGLILQAVSTLKLALPDDDLNRLQKEFEAVKNEVKNDFTQRTIPHEKIDLNKVIPQKREEPKIIKVPTRMVYPSFKSFKQTKQEIFKEFMIYVNKIYDVFKSLKVRFKDLRLEKYKDVLKKLAVNVADKLFKKDQIVEAVLKESFI